MRIFFLLILATFLVLDCGSSKKGLSIEDETDESLHGRALVAYEAGQYREAFRYDSLLLIHFPISDLHIEAQLNMANALGGQERYEDQLDLLLRLLGENIIPEAVPKIYVQIGEHYEHAAVWNPNDITNDTTDWEKAASYYRKAVFYPNSNDRVVKAQALYRAGLMYAKINNFEYATNAYNEVINSFPESPYSTLAKIKLQDPSNTSEIGFESDTAQQLEDDRKSVIESVVEEPVQEPDQFGIITPEDSTVQMEIVPPEADTGSEPQIDSGMEMPEMEDEAQDPALPDSSTMEEF
jgi:tetratricopeptide (TPR) repeat protein